MGKITAKITELILAAITFIDKTKETAVENALLAAAEVNAFGNTLDELSKQTGVDYGEVPEKVVELANQFDGDGDFTEEKIDEVAATFAAVYEHPDAAVTVAIEGLFKAVLKLRLALRSLVSTLESDATLV